MKMDSHPEIIKIKSTQIEMINNFTGFKSKPKSVKESIIILLRQYNMLNTRDVEFALSPYFHSSEVGFALNDLVFNRIVKSDMIKDILSLR
jgi:hypothetical protein